MKRTYLIFLLFIFGSLTPLISNENSWSYGFGLSLGTRGYGINSSIMKQLSPVYKIGLGLKLVDVVAEDELRGVNYYNQPVSYNDPRIISIPLSLNFIYYPFYGKIDNNFSPFMRVGAGAHYSVNGKNDDTGFFKNISQAKKEIGIALYFGGGVEFLVNPKMKLSISAGYDYLPLNNNDPDDFSNLNGLMLELVFQRNF